MSARTLETIIKITGDMDKKLGAGFDEAIRHIDKLSEQAEKSAEASKRVSDGFTVFKGVLSDLVSNGIQRAVSGLKDLAGSVVDVGMDFSSTMSEVQALSKTGDVVKDAENLAKLTSTAREYGASTQFSATEAAQALKYMALAGWDADQSASALGGVLDLAAASGMDLAAASDMVTDYMSAFGMEADKSAYFADVLAFAQANSNTSAEQLGEAYKNSAASLNAAGQDIETVTSLLEAMANQGTKGSEAGTQLKAMMRDLTAKMEHGAVKIGKTNVAVMDAQGNYRDLTDILRDVSNATEGMGDAQRAMALSSVFTSDSMNGLNLILNEGIDNVADYEEALRNSSGAAADMAATMNDNLAGDMKQMESAFDELKLKIFDGLEDPLRNAAQVVTTQVVPKLEELFQKAQPVFEGIANNIGPVLESAIDLAENGIGFISNNMDVLIPIVGALTAAFLAYKAISIATATVEAIKTAALATGTTITGLATAATWALNTALAFLTSPIFLVVAAIAAVVAAGIILYQHWDTIKAKAAELGAYLSAKWEEIRAYIAAVWDGIVAYLSGVWNSITGMASAIWNGLVLLMSTAWQSIQTTISTIWNGIVTTLTTIWNNIVTAARNFITTIKNAFVTGFSNLVSIVTAPFQTILGFIDGVIGKVGSLISSIGSAASAASSIKIPAFAAGGFTDGLSIAGEAGTEAVISFDPRYRADNLSYWAQAGRMLGADLSDFSLGAYDGGTVYDLGGVTFAPQITINGDAKKADIIEAIEEEEQEFMDMLEELLRRRRKPVYA